MYVVVLLLRLHTPGIHRIICNRAECFSCSSFKSMDIIIIIRVMYLLVDVVLVVVDDRNALFCLWSGRWLAWFCEKNARNTRSLMELKRGQETHEGSAAWFLVPLIYRNRV